MEKDQIKCLKIKISIIQIWTSKVGLSIGLDTGEGKISDLENRPEKIIQNDTLYLKERPTNPPP